MCYFSYNYQAFLGVLEDIFGCYPFSALYILPGDAFFRLFDFSLLEKDSTSVK